MFNRAFGEPSGGFNRMEMNPVDPVVAARWRGSWFALSFAFILKGDGTLLRVGEVRRGSYICSTRDQKLADLKDENRLA